MTGEDLAKLFDTAVLGVIRDNPKLITQIVIAALDKGDEEGVDLIRTIQSKMPTTSTTAPVTSAPVIAIADEQIEGLAKALDNATHKAKQTLVDALVDAGLISEDKVDDVVEDTVSNKLSDYCDEDQVRSIVNEAWNGA